MLQLTVKGNTPTELKRNLLLMAKEMGALDEMTTGHPDQTQLPYPISDETGAEADEETSVIDIGAMKAASTEKKTRTRKPKETKTPEASATITDSPNEKRPAEAPALTTAPTSVAASAPSTGEMTREAFMYQVNEFVDSRGLEAAVSIVGEFGYKKMSDIPAGDYTKIIARMKGGAPQTAAQASPFFS